MHAAAGIDIVAHAEQVGVHVIEIAGDGELLDRVLNLAILDPD